MVQSAIFILISLCLWIPTVAMKATGTKNNGKVGFIIKSTFYFIAVSIAFLLGTQVK